MSGAIAHHEEAERQNKEFNAVLRGARQAGWLSFRPDLEGKLVSCDREKWCRTLIEGTDRPGLNCGTNLYQALRSPSMQLFHAVFSEDTYPPGCYNALKGRWRPSRAL